jgi:epoxyqueuosine reductase
MTTGPCCPGASGPASEDQNAATPGVPMDTGPETRHPAALAGRIRGWARELGFQAIGFAGTDLGPAETRLLQWLAAGHHGEMRWMARHGSRRSRPAELVPGTLTVISARMDYLPPSGSAPADVIADPTLGYVSRYALGRDYHKVLRRRLARLARRIAEAVGPFGHRVFVDSAPVLEKPLAERAGLGWIGKHTNLLSREAGSWFFLGEIYTDLALPLDTPAADHCGRCTACIEACPTGAIVAPYRLDARRCIAYLTIELEGAIPPALRTAIGNRVYGCDDCQLVCPWNRFARPTVEADFLPRHGLDAPRLVELLAWSEDEFLQRTTGSPLRRLGHERWLRNVAVALGNAPTGPEVVTALRRRFRHPSALVREHVRWALQRHGVATTG